LSRLAVILAAIVLLAGLSVAALAISERVEDGGPPAGNEDGGTTPHCLPANPADVSPPQAESGELAGLKAELVADGLTDPVDVTQLPGWDLLLVAEKPGRIVALRDGSVLPLPVLDISDRVSSESNERGLVTIEADPRFEDTCRMFLFFTDLDGDSNLVSATVQGGALPTIDPESLTTLLVVPQKQRYHQSGSLEFGPDGMLWVSIGDGGLGQEQNAQDPQTLEGSVIRVDVDTRPYVATGRNPFGVEVNIPDTWSIGLRNPWRITIDPVERIVYAPDTGFETTEEVNIAPMARSGLNFGWPVTEGTECAREADCDTGAFTLPTYHHPRSGGDCAMIGGVVYRGSAIPELQGHYFFGDFCSSNIRSLRYEAETVLDVTEWKDDLDVGPTMTSFGTDIAGEMYVTTLAGQLWKIVPERS
jgi:glucose/arabinose dehydrogenase